MCFAKLNSFVLRSAWLWLVTASFARGDWQNSLKPAGPAIGEVVLVKDGKLVRPIRLPTNPTAIEKNAAAELQNWIEQITTARPTIATTGDSPCLRLQTDASLGEDGYRLVMDGNDLVLAGG